MSVMPLDSTNNIATEMTQRIGLNAQATYSPILRDTFYQLVPAEFKFYYMNTIRRALYWYQGFVPEIHSPNVGVPSTGIGNKIVKSIVKLVKGGDVFFENKYAEKDKNKVNETLKRFNKWSDEYHFQNTVSQLIEYAAAGGTSVGVAYVNEKKDLHIMPYRIDQCFYQVDFSNHCIDFTGFIGFYSAKVENGAGRRENDANFYILEHRYYDDKLKPMLRYEIKRSVGNVATGASFDIRQTSDMKWENLPKNIQKLLKRDFPSLAFGIDREIKFCDDLGVIVFPFTATNRIPEVRMGESVLLNAMGYLPAYEYAEAALWTDLYLGRGKVLIPGHMQNPTDSVQSYYQGYDSMQFTKIPMVNAEQQKPISIQFELRADEHIKTRNNFSEKIAAGIGVSGSNLFSYLRDVSGGSKTATQISEEAQDTISFVYEKRSLLVGALNKIVAMWKEFYQMPDEIKVRFSSQNMVNKLVSIDEQRAMKEFGYSTFDIIKKAEPDLDDDQILEKVERKFEEMKRIKEMDAQINMQAFEQRAERNTNGNPIGKGIVEEKETEVTEETEEIEMEDK